MATLKVFPELDALFKKFWTEKEKLVAERQPFRDVYEKLAAQIAPLEAKQREAAKKLKETNPRLTELDQKLSAIAQAMGGKTLSGN